MIALLLLFGTLTTIAVTEFLKIKKYIRQIERLDRNAIRNNASVIG